MKKHEYAEFYFKLDGTPCSVVADDRPVMLDAARALMLSQTDCACDYPNGIEIRTSSSGVDSSDVIKSAAVLAAGQVDISAMKDDDIIAKALRSSSESLPARKKGESPWVLIDVEFIRVGDNSGLCKATYWPSGASLAEYTEIAILLNGKVATVKR